MRRIKNRRGVFFGWKRTQSPKAPIARQQSRSQRNGSRKYCPGLRSFSVFQWKKPGSANLSRKGNGPAPAKEKRLPFPTKNDAKARRREKSGPRIKPKRKFRR